MQQKEPSTQPLFAHPLVRELTLILILKLSLLSIIWWNFFRQPTVEANTQSVTEQLLGNPHQIQNQFHKGD